VAEPIEEDKVAGVKVAGLDAMAAVELAGGDPPAGGCRPAGTRT